MQMQNVEHQLLKIIESNITEEVEKWLEEKIDFIIKDQSSKELYLTYSLIATKIKAEENFEIPIDDTNLKKYILVQKGNIQQIARIYLLIHVLNSNNDFFAPKVANIIQIADTTELETFLKFMIILPNAEYYKNVAVDALRTNISTVFNAIAYNNPYPSIYFDEQQWNQMYLKTAFMQGDLNAILDIDKRGNKELARIISDYAHERWAASRDIDPYFWCPVSKFIDDNLLNDMKRLLKSENSYENKAAALCLYNSDNSKAQVLLKTYPELLKNVEQKNISWNSLKK